MGPREEEDVTSPEVIKVATGGLTIKKAYDRICLEDFTKRVLGAWLGFGGGGGPLPFFWFDIILLAVRLFS